MASTWAWKSIHSKWVELTCMLNIKEVRSEIMKYQCLFNERLWRIKVLWRVIQTLIWGNLQMLSCSGKSSFPSFQHCASKHVLRWFCGGIHCLVESKTAEYNVSGWFRGHYEKNREHVKYLKVSYLISSGDCMFYTWWYHCKNH